MATRIVVVALVSVFSIWLWAPDLPRVFGHPLGSTGFKVGLHASVVSVDAGSSAQRAGIRPGDSVDFNATPLHSRMLIVNANFLNLHPIQRFPVTFVRGGRRLNATLTSEPESAADTATVLPRMAFALILLASGIALLMLRPGKATWGFFFFSAFNPGATINASIWYGPYPYQIAMTVVGSTAAEIVSQLGAIVFALYVLVKPPIALWRRIAERSAYAVGLCVASLSAWSIVSAAQYGAPIEWAGNLLSALQIALTFTPPLLLLITYAGSDVRIRERIRWVIFAFTVNALVFSVLFASQTSAIAIPYRLWGTLAGIDVFTVAFAVLYAVLKHHIIDINVAISRALVYTLLSAVIVGAFALVDMFFSRMVSARSGLIADIGLALVLGFFFNALHYRVDRFVDRVLFRQRHAAEEHVRTVIRGMPFTVSEAQVDALLAEEPVRSFSLTGSALFACDEDGNFDKRRSNGSVSLTGLSLTSRADALPVYLQGERCALRLNRHGWDVAAIAIPVFSHGDLTAIAIYGLHANGTDLDGDEIVLFEQLALAAGNAYDRLEAKSLREEVRGLREEVATLVPGRRVPLFPRP